MKRTRSESLAKASKDLMLKEPFYGFFLMNLNKMWDEKIPTACVGLRNLNYQLRLNPKFWDELPGEHHPKGLLKHELMHIGFFHLTDYDHYYTTGGVVDREKAMIMNIAMDLEINQYIDADWLPPGGQLLSTYPELELDEKAGSIYYYKALLKAREDGSSPTLDQILQDAAAGNETSNVNGETIVLPQHDWDGDQVDEATAKLLKAHTAHLVREIADQVTKSRGTIPGEMVTIIERLNTIEPAKFDWKGYIRRFAGKSIKTYTKKTRRKLSKRLPDNPGLRIKRQKHLLIGIDTSGSVSMPELKEFLNEIYHMQKTGSEITVMQYDSAISSVKRFNHREHFEITGRGGTDFQPGINFYNEHLRNYSCFINFTDGEAPAPDNVRGDVLWVHSGVSDINQSLPGAKIKLEL